MLGELFNNPASFATLIFALLVAITVHEYAHAYAAERLGDPTPRLAGRLTLNPLAHLDPIGTLMLLIIRLGWGKPVPVDPFNLRHPRRDMAIISFAGPLTNLITATGLSILLRIFYLLVTFSFFSLLLEAVIIPVVILNVTLAIFNLTPIHPLDGGKVLIGLLPEEAARKWDQTLSQYGFIILLFLIFPWFGFSLIVTIIFPLVNFILSILLPGAPLI